MLKIKMLASRPAPGGELLCYLAGQTYELGTEAEKAMGQGFIEEGAAVETKDVELFVTVSASLDLTDADKAEALALAADGKMDEAKALVVSKVKVKATPVKAETTETIVDAKTAEGLRKLAEAGGVTVDQAAEVVDATLNGFPPALHGDEPINVAEQGALKPIPPKVKAKPKRKE